MCWVNSRLVRVGLVAGVMVALLALLGSGSAMARTARQSRRAATTEARWRALPTLDVSKQDALNGVSCTSASSCMAVGSNSTMTLAEQWDGTSWTALPTGDPTGDGVLYGVSCVSASACIAVGSTGPDGIDTGSVLAERWNGSTWTIDPTPALGQPVMGSGLGGVSCSSASSCIAVGWFVNTNADLRPLAELWNGTSWKLMAVASPSVPQGTSVALGSVSCTSPGACVAVGDVGMNPLVEHWNGTAWEITHLPPSLGSLSSVSCSAARSCMTVGGIDTGVQIVTLGYRWAGLSWASQSIPGSTSSDTYLRGVSCPTTTNCTVVGQANRATLAERWINGRGWGIQPTPSPAGASAAELRAVSCTAATACVAVGDDNVPGAQQIVAMAES
jgi:hypothetical protein